MSAKLRLANTCFFLQIKFIQYTTVYKPSMMQPCTHKNKNTLSCSLKLNIKTSQSDSYWERGSWNQGDGVSIRLSYQLWGWKGLGPSGPAFWLSPSPVWLAAATAVPPGSLQWRPAAGVCRRAYPHPAETGTTFHLSLACNKLQNVRIFIRSYMINWLSQLIFCTINSPKPRLSIHPLRWDLLISCIEFSPFDTDGISSDSSFFPV